MADNILDEQLIQDPTTMGVSPLKGLDSDLVKAGLDRGAQTVDYGVDLFLERRRAFVGDDLRDLRRTELSNTPHTEFIGNEFVGDSRFDYLMDWSSDFLNLNDNRGRLQSGLELIGVGVLKGAVLAGTTFLDGTVGTVVGIGNVIAGGSFIDNPVSNALHSINNWSELALPNYYRDYEMNNPWYLNVFTANFLGDKLLKNAGFMIGAAYTGKAWSSLASKALKMSKLRQAYKGTMMEANTVGGGTAAGLPSGATTLKPDAIVNDLIASGFKAKSAENILKTTGAITAGIGESRIEALGTSESYIQLKKEILDAELEEAMANDKYNLLLEPGGEKYFQMIKSPNGQIAMDLTPEGTAYIYNKYKDLYEKGLALIHADAARVANTDFLVNMALLTTSDFIQFGKFYAGGYRNARKSGKIAKDATGQYVKETSKLEKLRRVVLNPFVEANEEMMQTVALIGSGYMYDRDSYLYAELDPEANVQTQGFLGAMAKAMKELYGDIDNYEEAFIGGLIGALGSPSRRGLQGGIAGEIREGRMQDERDLILVNELNKIQERVTPFYKNLVRNNAYERFKEDAVDKGDEFEFKNAEADLLISNVITYDLAGRIQDLLDMVEGFSNLSDLDVENIIAETTDATTGKSVYDGKTHELIREAVKRQAEHYSDIINTYLKISENLMVVAGKSHSSEALNELTYMAVKANDWENRFKSLFKEVKQGISNYNLTDGSGNTIPSDWFKVLSPEDFLSGRVEPFKNVVRDLLGEVNKAFKAHQEADKKSTSVEALEDLKNAIKKSKDNYNQSVDVYRLIEDLLKMLTKRAEFLKKYNDYLTKPDVAEKAVQDTTDKAAKDAEKFLLAEEQKGQIPTKDALRKALTLDEFNTILEGYSITGIPAETMAWKRRVLADELSKEDHPVAMKYMDILNTKRALALIINNDFSDVPDKDGSPLYTETLIDTALDILDIIASKAQTGQLLRDKLNPDLLNIKLETNELGDPIFKNPITANAAIKIILRAIDVAEGMSTDTSKPIMSISSEGKSTTATQSADPKPETKSELPIVEQLETPKQELTKKEVPTEETDPNTGEKAKVLKIQESIPTSTSKQMEKSYKEESPMDKKTDPYMPKGTKENPHKFWKPSFSQHALADLKKGILTPLYEVWGAIKSMHDYLTDNNAWNYVNTGKLKVGDRIDFVVDPKVLNREGVEGFVILLYKGDQVVGVLPEANADTHIGLQEVRDLINKEYQEFLKDQDNVHKVFRASIHTQVKEVPPGRRPFKEGQEVPFKEIKSLHEVDGPITFSYVKGGVYISPNVKDSNLDIGLNDTSSKEGRLYYRLKGADGKYYPAEVRTKHFNIDEFNIDDPDILKTSTYLDLYEALGEIYDGIIYNKKVLDGKIKVNNLLYFKDEVSFWGTTSQGQASILITSVDPSTKEHKFNHFIITGSPAAPEFVLTPEGMKQQGMSESTLRNKDLVIKEMMFALLAENPRFQISGSELNTGSYNKRFIEDGLITTNLVSAIPVSNWFKMAPIKADGTPYTDIELGIEPKEEVKTKPAVVSNSSPINGTPTVGAVVTVTHGDETFDIDANGKVIGSINPVKKHIVEDLAIIKLAAANIVVPGTSVQRFKENGSIRLKKANNEVLWFLLNDPKKNPGTPAISYMGVKEAAKAEEDYLKANPNERPVIEGDESDTEEFFWEVVRYVIKNKTPLTSDILRIFGLGYNKSNLIVERMASMGIVGEYNNESATREIFIENEELLLLLLNPKQIQSSPIEEVEKRRRAALIEAKRSMNPNQFTEVTFVDGSKDNFAPVSTENMNDPMEINLLSGNSADLRTVSKISDPNTGTSVDLFQINQRFDNEIKALQLPVKEKSKPPGPPPGFADIAKAAGLKVNENFKPKELALPADLSYEWFLDKFPDTVLRKGFTRDTWNKMSDAAKKHEINCASI